MLGEISPTGTSEVSVLEHTSAKYNIHSKATVSVHMPRQWV